MNSKSYVLLTGSKGNAGDFLIKYRAKQLLRSQLPNATINDFDAWIPLDDDKLEIINSSNGLILCGGPSLQFGMYPGIYALTKDLNQIKVNIITMGIGYKDQRGEWFHSFDFQTSNHTNQLLDRINESGIISSVRDFHTLYVLQKKRYSNFMVSGCPALYDLNYIGKPFPVTKPLNVIFSLGVSYLDNRHFFNSMYNTIVNVNEFFKQIGAKVKIAYHHKYNDKNASQARMRELINNLNLQILDISGTHEKLIHEYTNCDFHIGYRVHAHIFMCSISKPSILINEDGRGKGLIDLIGGPRIDCYTNDDISIITKIKRKTNKDYFFRSPIDYLPEHVVNVIEYELKNDLVEVSKTRLSIDKQYNQMQKFINQLK